LKTVARGRIGMILIILGLFLFRQCIDYMLFTKSCERARDRIVAAENQCIVIADTIALAEGTVMRAYDNGMSKIAYFHYWDGAIYYRVIPYQNPDYPENTKVIVAYPFFVGPGDCLVSGFYLNRLLRRGAVGLMIVIAGVIVIKYNEKRMENKNGEKENCSRKLENEYDAQSGGCSVQ